MKSLSEHITVDVYGKCGKLSCDRSDEGRSYYLIWAWARMVLANCCAGATACSTPATSSTSVWRTVCARDGMAQKIHFIHHTLFILLVNRTSSSHCQMINSRKNRHDPEPSPMSGLYHWEILQYLAIQCDTRWGNDGFTKWSIWIDYACSVVLNGANMSLVAPPHSYIRVEDFSSVIIEKYISIACKFIKIKLN